MKVNSINTVYSHPQNKILKTNVPIRREVPTESQQGDTVSFKGFKSTKHAIAGGTLFGSFGAIMGAIIAICLGDISITEMMASLGLLYAVPGAILGASEIDKANE